MNFKEKAGQPLPINAFIQGSSKLLGQIPRTSSKTCYKKQSKVSYQDEEKTPWIPTIALKIEVVTCKRLCDGLRLS